MKYIFFYTLSKYIFTDIINALDEGRFLWAQKTVENFTDNEKNIITPRRWTRSILNLLRSPLVNSIQDGFVSDSFHANLAPAAKYLKRCIPKKVSGLNVKERFKNEFFLWEDNEGNPLEFGLKQIQELKPYHRQKYENVFFETDKGRSSSIWEEPLSYEDNEDVKDIDINHLSYHEQLKLNDILKNKMHSVLTHIFPHRLTTRNNSLYYTLRPDFTMSTTALAKFGKEYFLKKLKTGYLTHINKVGRNCERKINREIGESIDINSFSALNTINVPNTDVWKHKLKNRSPYNYNAYVEETTTKTKIINSTPIFQQYITLISKSKDSGKVKGLFSRLDKSIHHGDNFASFWNNENKNFKSVKPVNIKKSFLSKENANHRDLRILHHGRFFKHRKKGKCKHKLKSPEGHSYQYELYNGNIIT